ncbi:mucin-6 isoform X2 [Aplysia californica]|uniref:Mucin-6 isoform X2 n=1 Tax=Aplysia californica TaxID=6500 RepID=A0ABM0JE23_APLCA|nr:mucin-6 isoform X2 [Aplysia californica]
MDLLLQAAKVLELEHSDDGTDRVSARSARDNGRGSLEDGIPAAERRRAGGAGTREVHNQLEKNRRKQLRECFNHLQQCVPSLENKRVATQSILQGAIKYIKHLKKKDVEQEREIQMLAKRKSELKKKYDLELNKCSEEEQRMAEVFLKVVNAETPHSQAEDDGHTSDSTTTASEGPGNEDDDLSEAEEVNMEAGYSITSYDKFESSRKRKAGMRNDSGGRHDSTSSRNHGTIIRHMGSKTSQSSASAAASSAMSSSSSVALKNMLEQRKKQQVTVTSQGARSSAGMSKSPIKSHGGSLTSSYPMISGHLASTPKSKTSSHPVPALPNPTRSAGLPDHASSELLSFAGAVQSHSLSATPVNSASDHTSTQASTAKGRKGEEAKAVVSRRSSAGAAAMATHTSPSVVINSIPSLPLSATINLTNPNAAFSSSLGSPVKTLNNSTMLQSNLTFLPPQVSGTMGTAQLPSEARRGEGLIPSPLKIPTGYNGSGDGNLVSSKPNLNHLSSTTTMPTQLSAAHLMEATLPNSKILPGISASLASLIRTLPNSSGLSPMGVSLASAPVTIPPQDTRVKGHSSSSSPALISSQPAALVQPAAVKTDSSSASVNPPLTLANKNARIATLLAAPATPNTPLRPPTMNVINSPGANPVSISLADAQKTMALAPTLLPLAVSSAPSHVAPTASISLSDPQKVMSFTPTLLPPHQQLSAAASSATPTASITLSDTHKTAGLAPTILPLPLASGPHTTASSSIISPGTPIRFFAPLTPSSMMASLGNGQTHLMPTVVQLGASGPVAVLQNLIPTGPHPLLAQPIIVMTTPSPITSTSQTMAGTKFCRPPSHAWTAINNIRPFGREREYPLEFGKLPQLCERTTK